MLTAFTSLRLLALLRRCARALESLAESQSCSAQVQEQEWAAQHAPRIRKHAEFGVVDVKELNKRYRERMEAEAAGMVPLEDEEHAEDMTQ